MSLDHALLLEDSYESWVYYCENCLKVQELDTLRVVPLRLKPVQLRLGRRIFDDVEAGRPCRLIVLKARREGVSTAVQSIFFKRAATLEHQHGMTLSHHDDTTKALFRMSERFYQHLPAEIRPSRRMSRTGEVLEFAQRSNDPAVRQHRPGLQSVLRTVTFKNSGAGQAANQVHCSEVGLWGGEAESVLSTLLPVVPHAAGTIVVLESTARGVGNTFYDLWCDAEGTRDRGGHGFSPFFVPWYEEPFYVMDPHPELGELDDEEAVLEASGVRADQLAWRRWIGIPSQPRASLDVFHQEYPSTPSEAFLSTGRPFFDQHAVADYRASCEAPEWIGDLLEEGKQILPRPSRHGCLSVWEMPDDAEDYLISVDCAEGLSDGDAQAAYVYKRSSAKIVAAWHGRIPRDDLGDELYRLGRVYHDALIAIELNGGWGEVPLYALRRRGYPRLYRRRDDNTKRAKAVRKYGWMTTPATRVLALDALAELIRTGDLECKDQGLFDEAATFIIDDGKPQASPGRHDDRVMAAAIGAHLWLTTAKRPKPSITPPRRALSATTGY